MSRKIVIVGNWKMNKTPSEAKAFMKQMVKLVTKNESKINGVKYGIASPSVDIATVKEFKTTGMIVAAENFNENTNGAYTGELSAAMIKAAGANAVVIGHSERRAMYNETDKSVNAKTVVALENKLLPIVCMGETLEERKAKKWKAVVKKQFTAALKGLTSAEVAKVVIAYEPIWAIGTGVTASAEEAQEVCKYIRGLAAKSFDQATANKLIIQYGGSVKPENVAELMGQADIDGALVGGASLEAESFVKLLTLNK